MSETYRAAVIGTGGISRTHAGYYKAHPRVELVAGSDINPDKLDAWCEAMGVEGSYLDHEQMLEEVQLDIVSVCTWNSTHMELSVAAAEAGAKAVISEKPMGEDLGGPMDGVKRLEELGCKFVVHHQTRFSTGYNSAKELIAEGAIGSPVGVYWNSGGGLLNVASHLVDNCRWILGEPDWTGIFAAIERKTNRFERGTWCEDRTHALIEFEGGHRLVLAMDIVPGRKYSEWSFVGPEGVIHFDRSRAVCHNAEGTHEPEPPAQPGFLEELIDWLEGGPEHRNIAGGALVTQQILMAIYHSARTRALIEPPYERRESPLAEMIASGELPAEGEPYDIRLPEALAYARERYGRGT